MINTESKRRRFALPIVGLLMIAASAALLIGAAIRSQENMVTSGLVFLTMGVLCTQRHHRPLGAGAKAATIVLIMLGAALTIVL